MTKLVSFRISAGWAVLYNTFFEDEMIIIDDEISNNMSFKEDVLSIEELDIIDGIYSVNKNGFCIDLGWYPDSNPNGEYILTVLNPDWDNIFLEYKSKNKMLISKVLESCLSHLRVSGLSAEEILARAFE